MIAVGSNRVTRATGLPKPGRDDKKQAHKIASIFAACHVYNIMGSGADSELISESENNKIAREMESIAEKIIRNDAHMLGSGDLDSIIEYVLENY